MLVARWSWCAQALERVARGAARSVLDARRSREELVMNTVQAEDLTGESLRIRSSTPYGRLPLVVSPARGGEGIMKVFPALREQVERSLPEHGGILFRGFQVDDVAGFREFCAAFGHPLLGYEFGSTPRTKITEGVYSSTEYPAHQHIPLHNEQSYSREWPLKIWFYCAVAPGEGGETPIADSREVYRRVDRRIRERFVEHGLMYVRNFGNGLDVPWPQVFNTDSRDAVDEFCRRHGIACEWKDDGELRTRQICQAVARHPGTGDMVWFNQAHLFHISGLEPEVREALLDAVGEDELPRNVYYGDGEPIEDSILDEVRGVLGELQVAFPWETGDIMMLDNMLAAHARNPFKGARRVIAAMAQGYSEDRG
ncbi:TauD/TfdA family dioxygenase [Sorangium sp. So ce204]|uniref:TauD/TfdA family dioxygenase n=1 Tax=Sorangium sp. So ce204 TaxID=3133288 RepID=UPI003F60AC82